MAVENALIHYESHTHDEDLTTFIMNTRQSF